MPSGVSAICGWGGLDVNETLTAEFPSPARLGGGGRRYKILFVSYHCLLDPSSGAAISAIDLLELLGSRGWNVRAFCGPLLDSPGDGPIARRLADQRVDFHRRRPPAGFPPVGVLHFRRGCVPGMVFEPSSFAPDVAPDDAQAFLALYQRLLDRFCPDVIVTYGGHRVAGELMRRARQRGVRVVFWLRNFAYRDARLFQPVDAVLVASQFAANHYARLLGLQSTVIPSPLDWSKIQSDRASGQHYVTFVNPHPTKGVFVFARIAEQLYQHRPDIPLLVVEGRGGAGWLGRTGVDLCGLRNLYMMANTPDPRDFYRVSRVVLMPSLWREAFGRVAAEAIINGIPVLATNRGGLPETLRDAGFLLPIASDYTSESRVAPTADEVGPWVKAIIDLWDDQTLYEREQVRCRRAAQAWQPEHLAAKYDRFFRQLAEYNIVEARHPPQKLVS